MSCDSRLLIHDLLQCKFQSSAGKFLWERGWQNTVFLTSEQFSPHQKLGLSRWIVSIWSCPSYVSMCNNQVCISRLDVSWLPHPYPLQIIFSLMTHRNIKLSIFKSESFKTFTNEHFAAVLIFVTNSIFYSLFKHTTNPEFCNYLGTRRIEN